VDRGHQQASTVSLVMWQGCRTQAAAKRFVSGCSGASMAGPGGVLRVQEGCAVVSALWKVVLDGAEQGMRLSLMMMWQVAWTREASWWADAVLYTPPPVLLDSDWTARSPSGVQSDSLYSIGLIL
jgi:hypothetical protein